MLGEVGKYRRRNSLRLQGYDYSDEGIYFITCVTKKREPYFGKVVRERVELNELGQIIAEQWLKSEEIRKEVILGEFIVMPDHFHGLVMIDFKRVRAHGHAPQLDPTFKNTFGAQSKNLSALIRSFKANCTAQIRRTNPTFAWQRSYHDRIVRNQHELERIEEYIFNNPLSLYLNENPMAFIEDIKN